VTLFAGKWHAAFPSGRPDAVSCATADHCVAVGTGIDTFQDGAWRPVTITTTGLGAVTARSIGLTGVSCPAAGSCTAVGTYTGGDQSVSGLIVTLSDDKWDAALAPIGALSPNPQSLGLEYVELDGVSCPVADFCAARGLYGANDLLPFFETSQG
jgi:hypothetical protein